MPEVQFTGYISLQVCLSGIELVFCNPAGGTSCPAIQMQSSSLNPEKAYTSSALSPSTAKHAFYRYAGTQE